MKNTILLIVLFITCNFMSNSINAQLITGKTNGDSTYIPDSRKHSLNFCPAGLPFGIFSANYEYLLDSKHGLVVRGDYEMIPQTYSDADIEPFGYSFTVNYRRHFTGEMSSPFVGVYARHRVFQGKGKYENTPFDFRRSDWSYGFVSGKKWVWQNGLNVTFAWGYGFSVDRREVSISNPLIEAAIDEFEEEYDFMSPLTAEISIGYTF